MHKKIEGCLFGMALGDALGANTEFLRYEAILEKYGANGIQDLVGNPALVTDDTQMAIAVAEALIEAPRPYTTDSLETALSQHFIKWYQDPKNNRAPGMTCLSSIERLMSGAMTDLTWHSTTNIGSKGCGANMRVQAVGLLPEDEKTRAGIAQLQSAITHAHPTALIASDITAWVIHDLAHNGNIATLVDRCLVYAQSQRHVYHDKWLGRLYERDYFAKDGATYIERGWDEIISILYKIQTALKNPNYHADPCLATGEGWIAEEAFATALYCFLLYPDNPTKVIQRGANSSGDSDSIACIAGAFAGAYHGIDAWQTEWVTKIEYHDVLKTLANQINALHIL
ncbi:MAG: ADP-ribosylglycohydrolase family protein [Phototrophicaceae bacterium]